MGRREGRAVTEGRKGVEAGGQGVRAGRRRGEGQAASEGADPLLCGLDVCGVDWRRCGGCWVESETVERSRDGGRCSRMGRQPSEPGTPLALSLAWHSRLSRVDLALPVSTASPAPDHPILPSPSYNPPPLPPPTHHVGPQSPAARDHPRRVQARQEAPRVGRKGPGQASRPAREPRHVRPLRPLLPACLVVLEGSLAGCLEGDAAAGWRTSPARCFASSPRSPQAGCPPLAELNPS